MSSKISLWAGLIGVAATIPLVQTIAIAKSPVEIAETAKTITVLITAPGSVGSGVILQQQGDIYTVLTAAHVVKSQVSYKITTSDDRSYQIVSSSIRRAPSSIDLAVVKFKSTAKYPTAKLGNCNLLKSGMDIYVAGFPGTSAALTESVLVVREGRVSANSNKTFEKGYSLVYSNDTLPGMSGGAVLNTDGELVAIHGRGDRDRLTDGKFGSKNGFNLGIPINRFATVANNLGVELGGRVAPIPTDTAPKADDYFTAAVQKHEKGDYRGALADYNQAIALDPKNANVYGNRGWLKSQQLNDVQGALADYNQAISLGLKDDSIYGVRGLLKERLNDIRGALADYNQEIALHPKSAISYSIRGSLKDEKLNDVQGALADYNQAIALDPKSANSFNVYRKRSTLRYQRLNDVQGALADITKKIELFPFFASDGYYSRGDIHYSTGNRSAAIADFQKVAPIGKSGALELIAQGVIQIQQREYSQAIDLLNKATEISPEAGDIYKYRGVAYKNQGNRAAAISDWRQAAKIYKQDNATRDYKMVLGWLKELGAGE
jgi:tetratricopeptide (TPR) repeat protein